MEEPHKMIEQFSKPMRSFPGVVQVEGVWGSSRPSLSFPFLPPLGEAHPNTGFLLHALHFRKLSIRKERANGKRLSPPGLPVLPQL